MTFVEQLQQASDATLAATMYNARSIAAEDVPQGDIAQATRVATAHKVVYQCMPLIQERIREQGPDGTMMECVMREHAKRMEEFYAPTRD
tara:strand:- start:1113 stop:1382 length:270 start_codon:yes stop_codon:yes gene_type:complete